MKIKRKDILNRLSLAWWAISGKKHMLLIEKCERCGSHHLEVGANKTVKDEDGIVTYYAKYFCKICGCSCICTEVWEDNALLEFGKK